MKRKSNILTIMKKELRRIFGDRRMLVTLFLPGIMIYLLYTVMGETMFKNMTSSEEDTYTIAVEHMPASLEGILKDPSLPFDLKEATGTEADALQNQVLHLHVVFPEDFDQAIATYDPQLSGVAAPEVRIFYNSSSSESTAAYQMFTSLLDSFESSMANRFDINRTEGITYDLATPEDMTGMLLSTLMPLLLTTLLFSGCMAVAPESIAGEKERGTLATLLVTPLRRWELAIGKIGALSIVALISGLWSFLGVMMALPNLMGGDSSVIDTNVYGAADYLWLLAVILTTILVYISAISVLSALARSAKEAASTVSPLMLVVVLISMSGMIFPDAQSSTWAYLIPVYNSAQCVSGIFSFSYEPIQLVLTLVSNLVLTSLLVLLLTRLFNSEKVMFKK